MSATSAAVLAARREVAGSPERRVSVGPQFELREVPSGTGGTNLKFSGFASVTNVAYPMVDRFGPFDEIIARGAFQDAIDRGADLVFLVNHEGLSLARVKSGTLTVEEVMDPQASPVRGVTGLWCEASLDPANHLVAAMRSAVERGDLDEMSFAFQVPPGGDSWSEDAMVRTIHRVELQGGDCSVVNFGANPHTGGTVSLRQRFTGRLASRAATHDCEGCNGTGQVTCATCDGSGSVIEEREAGARSARPHAPIRTVLSTAPLPHFDFSADWARLAALRNPPARA